MKKRFTLKKLKEMKPHIVSMSKQNKYTEHTSDSAYDTFPNYDTSGNIACMACGCLYDDKMKGAQGRDGSCECSCGHQSLEKR